MGAGRSPAKKFKGLIVWKKAHSFVLSVYRFAESFPKNELYGLIPRLQRAAVSIAANIAEGFKRRGRTNKARFMNISQGSVEECRYYLILARDLGYGEITALNAELAEVSKLLLGYTSAILNSDS